MMPYAEIAEDYDLAEAQIREAQGFYDAHQADIDAYIQMESQMEPGDK